MSLIEYSYEEGIEIKVGDSIIFTITKFGFTKEEPPSSTYPGAPSDVEVLEVWGENEGRKPFLLTPGATGVFGNLYGDEIRREVLLHRKAMNESWSLERKLEEREGRKNYESTE